MARVPIRDVNVPLWPCPCTLVVLRGDAVMGYLNRSVEGWRFNPATATARPSRRRYDLPGDALGRRGNGSETVMTYAEAVQVGILEAAGAKS